MTRRRVSDEQFGQLTRRADELRRRVYEGTLPFDSTMDGLQMLIQKNFFTFTVDFDAPRWRLLEGKYSYVNPSLHPEHFPVTRKGKAMVTVEPIVLDRPTSFQDELAECKRLGLPQLDRAISETFFDINDEERQRGWILAPCGAVAGVNLAYVRAGVDGRDLYLGRLDDLRSPGVRFLRVCEIKPLAA